MVRYRTPQQTQTKKRGFQTKRDAKEFADTVEVEEMTGQYVAPSAGRGPCRDLDSDQDRVLGVIAATRFVAVTPGDGNRDFGPCGAKRPLREPLSIAGPARKNDIAGRTPYCADFLRLVHDEMVRVPLAPPK
jgi:Arm DNA-binding domain